MEVIRFSLDQHILLLKNQFPKSLFLISLLMTSNLQAEITRDCFSLKINMGASFSRTTLQEDFFIKNGNVMIFCPEFSCHMLSRRKNIVEVGLKILGVGNRLMFLNSTPGISSSTIIRNTVPSLSVLFHKRVATSNHNTIYFSLGTVISYLPNTVIFTSTDSFRSEETRHTEGVKIAALTGFRYIFYIRNRNLGIDINYSKGFINYYQVETINSFNKRNEYTNSGSNLTLGLIYFFGKHNFDDGEK